MLSGRVTDILNVKGDKIPSGPIKAELQATLDLHGVCVLSELATNGTDQMHVVLEPEAVDRPELGRGHRQALPGLLSDVDFHTVHACRATA